MASVITTSVGRASVEAVVDILNAADQPCRVLCPDVEWVGLLQAVLAAEADTGCSIHTLLSLDRVLVRPDDLRSTIERNLTVAPEPLRGLVNHADVVDRIVDLQDDFGGLDPATWRRLVAMDGIAFDVLALGGPPPTEVVHVGLLAGPLIWLLPDGFDPRSGRLINLLHRRDDVTFIVGITGDAESDQRHIARINGWGLQIASASTAHPAVDRRTVSGVNGVVDLVRSAVLGGTSPSDVLLVHEPGWPQANQLRYRLRVAELDRVVVGSHGGGRPFELVVAVGQLGSSDRHSEMIDDGLFPDQARSMSGGLVPPLGDRSSHQHHRRAVDLASSNHRPIVIDLGGSGFGPAVFRDQVVAASVRDHLRAGEPLATHEASFGVAGERAAHRLNRVGVVGSDGLEPGLVDLSARPLSATGVEDYARCPRRYLFGRVLRMSGDRRRAADSQTPQERGAFIHTLLAQFVAEMIERQSVPEPDEQWSSASVGRLFEIAGEIDGSVRDELESWVAGDNELRATRRSRPIAVELEFGFGDDGPAPLTLGDGTTVLMRGAIDRVDATDDDGLLVIDYKTGPDHMTESLSLDGGRRMQLPVYAFAASRMLGRSGPRSALYWLTATSTFNELVMDASLENEFDQLMISAAKGISAGEFNPTPSFDSCRYCSHHLVCPERFL